MARMHHEVPPVMPFGYEHKTPTTNGSKIVGI